jgi:glycosyltransferase involved in cell wall biosynthesis
MEDKKPLLSICIPTYNRAEYLDKCITSIVSQKEFHSDDVELVISDNASADNTGEIVRQYQNQHKNIRYFRNDENILDSNLPAVIANAHGVFRKLCNDTLIYKNGAIGHMLDVIRENAEKRPVLFFMNQADRKSQKKLYITNSFDSFVRITSFLTTAITCFGIWEDDFEQLDNKYEGCPLHLWQTYTLLKIVAKKNQGFIDNEQLFSVQGVQKKDLSYGLYQVFYKNYLGLFQQYLTMQILSNNVFGYLRKHLLLDFFLQWIINYHFDHRKYKILSGDDIEKSIFDEYRGETYYMFFCLKLKVFIFRRYIKKLING